MFQTIRIACALRSSGWEEPGTSIHQACSHSYAELVGELELAIVSLSVLTLHDDVRLLSLRRNLFELHYV